MSKNCIGQSTIIFEEGQQVIPIGTHIDYFLDKEDLYDFERVSSPQFEEMFSPSNQQVLNFKVINYPLWLKFTVQNYSKEELLLEIDNSNLDSLFFYYPDPHGNYKSMRLGVMIPEKSPIEGSDFLMPLNQTEKSQTYYVCIRNTGTTLLPIRIGKTKYILNDLNVSNIYMAGYFGILLALLLYNLFLGISIQDDTYYFYVMYVFGFGLNLFYMKGFASVLMPEYKLILYYITPCFLSLSLVAMMVFTVKFLDLFQHNPLLGKWLIGVSMTVLLYLGLRFTSLSAYSIIWFQILSLVLSLSALAIGIYLFIKGRRIAKYYLLAWSVFWVFIILYLMIINDFLPYYDFTPQLLPVGSEIEMILLSFALADKINVLRIEKQNIQHEKIFLIKEQNAMLEKKVEERTIELREKNYEIETQNEELRQQKEETESLNNRLEELVALRTEELKETLDNLIVQYQDLDLFSFIVSHNLRAPVARLLGLISIMDYENPGNESNAIYLKYIEQTTLQVDLIIKDLAHTISIRNSFDRSREFVPWDDLFDSCLTTLETEIQRVNAKIECIVSEDTPVYGIKTYLQSILYNLVSNAIKFRHPARELNIVLEAKREEDQWCLSVTDNGLGIDLEKEHLFQIFGLYKRLHTHVEGKGLGLYLVKTQVEALGGRIEVVSKLNQGSTFNIFLPITYP